MNRIALALLAFALTLGLSAASMAGPMVSLTNTPSVQPTTTPTPTPKKVKKAKKVKVKKAKKTKAAKKGAAPRFEDQGLTIFDHDTGKVWAKKTNDGSVHDGSNTYSLSVTGTVLNGTALTGFLPAIDGYAGYPACTDMPFCTSLDGATVSCFTPPAGSPCWRVPQLDELQTVVNCSFGPSCIAPVFGAVAAGNYWSATSSTIDSYIDAWTVNFADGTTNSLPAGLGAGILPVLAPWP